jgi:quercetin dioxygenase-like cupin family protein
LSIKSIGPTPILGLRGGFATTYWKRRDLMKVIKLSETNEFTPGAMKRFFLVEDSEFFKIINFNLEAGVIFPVHSHDLDGDLSIQVIEGSGYFLGEGDAKIPAEKGDILISEIREPHGVEAKTNMRIVVTIAPPI